MKDSFGSVFNLTLLFAFILVVSGFVLFGVNYYKAFQVKNNLLTLIEKYEGNVNNDKFKEKVESLVNRVGYHPGQSAIASLQNKSENYWTCIDEEGWCYSYINKSKWKDGQETRYYDVVTFVSTDIPLVNRIMGDFKFFQVTGRTKPIIIRK